MKNKKQMVVGFMFNELCDQIVLIKKQKPEWQKGKINGVGGKVEENEDMFCAMAREFKEETGVQTAVFQWQHYCTCEGITDGVWWELFVFYTVDSAKFIKCKTTEEEEIIKIPIRDIWKYPVIHNLLWLVPLALQHRRSLLPEAIKITYRGLEIPYQP